MIQFGFVWGSVTKQELRDSAPVTYQDITPKKVEKALVQIDDTLNGGCWQENESKGKTSKEVMAWTTQKIWIIGKKND